MAKKPETIEEWQKLHYEVEKEYVQRILKSPKGSDERKRLFEEGYTKVIGDIIEKYAPGKGGTD